VCLFDWRQVCEYRAAVDWDTGVAPPHVDSASETSLYVAETLGDIVSELECEELITPAKRELDAERRVAAPATGVARRVTADQVRPLFTRWRRPLAYTVRQTVQRVSESSVAIGWLIDVINVLCPTWHKIGNFWDVLPSQSLVLVAYWKK